MEHILEVVQQFYQNNASVIYEKANYLIYSEHTVKRLPLARIMEEQNKPEAIITRTDKMSDNLAYAQAEYRDDAGYHTEIIGLIFTKGAWRVMCVLGACTPHRFTSLYGDQYTKQQEDLQVIAQVLLQYCHDVYKMDANDCLSLFWPEARMYHPNEDGETFTDIEIQVLHQRWKDMPDPKELGISEFSRIYHVEMLDANTAIAKIGCAKLETYFNDYLSLMKLDGSWKIVNKMTQSLHTGKRV